MTKKDYVVLADALHKAFVKADGADQEIGVIYATDQVAAVLAAGNPRFDVGQFAAAALWKDRT